MKYKIKILYKDKVEPTQVVESDDSSEISDKFNNILNKEIFNEESSVIGILVMVSKSGK